VLNRHSPRNSRARFHVWLLIHQSPNSGPTRPRSWIRHAMKPDRLGSVLRTKRRKRSPQALPNKSNDSGDTRRECISGAPRRRFLKAPMLRCSSRRGRRGGVGIIRQLPACKPPLAWLLSLDFRNHLFNQGTRQPAVQSVETRRGRLKTRLFDWTGKLALPAPRVRNRKGSCVTRSESTPRAHRI